MDTPAKTKGPGLSSKAFGALWRFTKDKPFVVGAAIFLIILGIKWYSVSQNEKVNNKIGAPVPAHAMMSPSR